MKNLLFFAAALFPAMCMGETLIGTATLHLIDGTGYQPDDGCAAIIEVDGEEECFLESFTLWRRYELFGLKDIRGTHLGTSRAVLSSHTPRGGKWLLVLEKLSADEALKFGAMFKVIDGSPVFEGACLSAPLEDYDSTMKSPPMPPDDKETCYSINSLRANNQPPP